MWMAVTRAVSPALGNCDLEYLHRREVDVARAIEQHARYEAALAALGATIVRAPAEPALPDSVFVEDPAIVLDEVAVLTAMRSPVRARETETLATLLGRYRPLRRLKEPAILEGGDVLRIGRRIFVGCSSRSNAAGVAQLAAEIEPLGYSVHPVEVRGCLHLKTGCCYLGNGTLLANRGWIDMRPFEGFVILETPAAEPYAANVISAGSAVLMAAGFPQTAAVLDEAGWSVETVDISEFSKAEAGLTCMSILFHAGMVP